MSGSSARFETKLRSFADDELARVGAESVATGSIAQGMTHDTAEVVAVLREIENSHLERSSLKKRRATYLAESFQSSQAENKEFASLVVCATAGIFAVSVHFAFFSIFAVSYAIYRSSTKQVRIQRNSVTLLQEALDELRELERADVERIEALRAKAAAWVSGERVAENHTR